MKREDMAHFGGICLARSRTDAPRHLPKLSGVRLRFLDPPYIATTYKSAERKYISFSSATTKNLGDLHQTIPER